MKATLSREQLEDRLAALHQASLELVQDISQESLLMRLAELASEQARARFAAVGVLGENGELERFITVGMSDEEVANMEHPPVGLGLIGALMHGSETIRIPDIAADERAAGFPPNHPPMKSLLGVPIVHSGRQLGQIYITDKIGADEFSPDDQQVIETLAAYAAAAIANARLYRQLTRRDRILTRRNENLALINELAATLASSTDVDAMLDRSLTQIMDYLKLEAGEIFLRRGDTRILTLAHHKSRQVEHLFTSEQFRLGEGVVGRAALSAQSDIYPIGSQEEAYSLHPSLAEQKIHQVACIPLVGRQGVLGVLCVATSSVQPLGELEMQFLSAIGAWFGATIENLMLNLQQRRLAILEERERIGMDLHDGVIQSIYAVGLTLEHARLLLKEDSTASTQRIEQAINDLNSTIRDIRSYILDLRPRQLHDENLMAGVRRLINEFRRNATSTEVSLQGPETFANLPELQAVALFHICQEALANVAKHSRARHVSVALWQTADRVLLEVMDDGRGFDATNTRSALGHGLSNMFTRARNVGGDVEISSEPGSGTTILAWVPTSKDG